MSLSDLGSQTAAVARQLNANSAARLTVEVSEALARLDAAVERLTRLAERPIPKALTLDEAAAQLSVSPRTLARMAKQGLLRTTTLGRRVLVPVSELDRLLAPPEQMTQQRPPAARRAPVGRDEAAALRAAIRRR